MVTPSTPLTNFLQHRPVTVLVFLVAGIMPTKGHKQLSSHVTTQCMINCSEKEQTVMSLSSV